jgi:uncharacterized protein (TIGR02118 family)
MIKLVYCITKKNDMSTANFQKYWKEVHTPIGAKIPGIRRFVQNFPIEIPGDSHKPEFDGMVELWFDDQESLLKARSSAEWQRSSADEENFIDSTRVAYFVCEEREVQL